MTCIVGYKAKGSVWIGADSMGATNSYGHARKDSKVFQRGPFLFGFTDSFRMGNLLRYSFKPPRQTCKDNAEFMTTVFINSVRDCLKNGGYLKKKDNVESGGEFLVAYKNELYEIDSDFQVALNVNPYNSVGAGYQYAFGSLKTSQTMHTGAEEKIKLALVAAAEFSPWCCPPFNIMQAKNEKS